MNIIFFGKGDRGIRCLELLMDEGYDISAFIGVGENESCLQFALGKGIPCLVPEDVNSEVTQQWLESRSPDLFILSGYNRILGENIFSIPSLTSINLHGGCLPEYRGAAPINWQIINGEKRGACCILEVDEGIDTGPILVQKYYDIEIEDDHYSILKKTLQIFPALLVEVVSDIENYLRDKTVQNPNEGAYYTRRYPEDSKINWKAMTDMEVYNLIRAMHGPYPWAFSFLDGKKVEFKSAELLDVDIYGMPGRVTRQLGDGVIIICSNKGILIRDLRLDGQIINASEIFSYGEMLS